VRDHIRGPNCGRSMQCGGSGGSRATPRCQLATSLVLRKCQHIRVHARDSRQSRKRPLAQVMPEAQPSSCGRISQRIPLRRTNRIPVRQARSGKRALPPSGWGCGVCGSLDCLYSVKGRYPSCSACKHGKADWRAAAHRNSMIGVYFAGASIASSRSGVVSTLSKCG
jgi:hypothetical protein